MKSPFIFAFLSIVFWAGLLIADCRGPKFDEDLRGQVYTNCSRWFASHGIGGQSLSRCASRRIGL